MQERIEGLLYCDDGSACHGYSEDAKQCSECEEWEAESRVLSERRKRIKDQQKWINWQKDNAKMWLSEKGVLRYGIDWLAVVNSRRRWWSNDVERQWRVKEQRRKERQCLIKGKRILRDLKKLLQDPEALQSQKTAYKQAQTSPT